MTVSTTANRNTFTGDGVMTVFPFTFAVQQATDIDIYLDGVLTVSGYTAAINSSGVGGTITFSVAPALDVAGLIYRDVPYTQQTALPIESNLPETVLEQAYDKLTMLCQQLKEGLDRSIALPITSTETGIVFPSPEADLFIAWNPAGDALINTPGIEGPQGIQGIPGVDGTDGINGEMVGPGSSVIGNLPTYADILGTTLDDSGYSINDIMAEAADPAVNGFRLSLHATDPTPADTTSALTIYSIPYKGNRISLWDSAASRMKAVTSGIISEAIAATTHYFRIGYIYEYLNTGVADLEIDWWDSAGQSTKAITLLTIANPCVITCTAHGWNVGDKIGIRRGTAAGTAWTNTDMGLDGKEFYISAKATNTLTLEGCDTSALAVTNYTGATAYRIPATPTTAAAQTEGVWFKSGDRTRRLVGLFKTNSAGTIDSSSVLRRNLSNVDNQIDLPLQAIDANASWTSAAVANTQPRSGSLAMGTARAEFALALPQTVLVSNTDSAISAGAASAINQNRVSSEAIGAFSIARCWANLGYASGYPSTVGVTESIGVAAGGHFMQRMALGSGLSFHGKTYNSNGGANSLIDINLRG